MMCIIASIEINDLHSLDHIGYSLEPISSIEMSVHFTISELLETPLSEKDVHLIH